MKTTEDNCELQESLDYLMALYYIYEKWQVCYYILCKFLLKIRRGEK